MPCNTIQNSKIELLAQSTDLSLLRDALEQLGFHVLARSQTKLTFYRDGQQGFFDKSSGQLQLAESWDSSEIKRAYSTQVIESQAKRFGWQLEWSTNAAGHREATVRRRG
jgi:hypothetical protein